MKLTIRETTDEEHAINATLNGTEIRLLTFETQDDAMGALDMLEEAMQAIANATKNALLVSPTEDRLTSNTPGVQKQCNKYRARIRVNGKTIGLGTFETEQQATNAYAIARADRDGLPIADETRLAHTLSLDD